MPPGPSGQPPAPVPAVPAVVLLLQAARMPEMLESESAAPPDRRRKSRRVPSKRRSFGCIRGPPILTDWPVSHLVRATVTNLGALSRTTLTRRRRVARACVSAPKRPPTVGDIAAFDSGRVHRDAGRSLTGRSGQAVQRGDGGGRHQCGYAER